MVARGRLLGLLVGVVLVLLCGSAQASPSAPVVSVEPPSGIATGEATLRGQVNPGEQATTYQFEYGTTTSYGTSAPATPASAGSGTGVVAVSQHISGLQPGVKYHFRLVATNATETVHGEDATFATYSFPDRQSGDCPNEERRAEQGTTWLPDCRAYEMVSPLDKNGSNVVANTRMIQASVLGDRVVFPASAGIGDSSGSGVAGLSQYLALRKEGVGWESHGVTPTPKAEPLVGTWLLQLSSDLRHAVVSAYDLTNLTDDIPSAYNYYLEDTETKGLETITTPLGSGSINIFSVTEKPGGVSEDLGVVTFETKANLLPTVTGSKPKLYAWEHGVLKIAGVMPDGLLPVNGSQEAKVGGDAVANRGTVSRDGSRIVFVSKPEGSSQNQLYIRTNGETTTWVSEPERAGASSEPGEVEFWGMTADGKKILFSSEDQLTSDDPGGAGVAYYMYTDSPAPESESNLRFIARGVGGVTGMSEDGGRIYFGSYLWDEGVGHVIPDLGGELQVLPNGVGGPSPQVEVSSDGRTLAFLTHQRLGGAAVGTINGQFPLTLYVYDERSETLTCASCIPTGQPTASDTEVEPFASYVVAYPSKLTYQTRFLSSDGQRVFFTTADPLVAQDTNGVPDVYEYDVATRHVSLLSTGTGGSGAWLSAADAEGKNVFIATRQSLLQEDTDTLVDLYDIRVGGGFPQPHIQSSCAGDECQGTPSAAPSFNTASGFSGLGNVAVVKSPTGSPSSHKSLTRAQRLERALKICRGKPKSRRRRCVANARKRYGAKGSVKKASQRVGR
jgi:WD40 repeat protein